MDERRVRLYLSIVLGLFIFTAGRIITDTNPIYDIGEPLFSRLDNVTSGISPIGSDPATNQQALQSLNDSLKSENEKLRGQLELKSTTPFLNAEISRRELQSFRRMVWINVGENDGVKVGQTVTHKGAIFGVVDETFDDSAHIRTVLDPDFRATITISGQQGILKVEHGSLIADLIPSKELEGQSILTDGLDGRTVAGLNVGISDNLVSDTSDVFGAYNVLLPYQIYDVQFVEVLKTEVAQ